MQDSYTGAGRILELPEQIQYTRYRDERRGKEGTAADLDRLKHEIMVKEAQPAKEPDAEASAEDGAGTETSGGMTEEGAVAIAVAATSVTKRL